MDKKKGNYRGVHLTLHAPSAEQCVNNEHFHVAGTLI